MEQIEFYVTAKKSRLEEAMKIIFDQAERGQITNVMDDSEAIHMTLQGSWTVYQRISNSMKNGDAPFTSLEHFEDEKEETPQYWVSTSTNGQDANYTNYNG